MQIPDRLFNFPVPLMQLLGKIVGVSPLVSRLSDSLQVNAGKSRMLLEWNPPFTLDEGLQKTVQWFKAQG